MAARRYPGGPGADRTDRAVGVAFAAAVADRDPGADPGDPGQPRALGCAHRRVHRGADRPRAVPGRRRSPGRRMAGAAGARRATIPGPDPAAGTATRPAHRPNPVDT